MTLRLESTYCILKLVATVFYFFMLALVGCAGAGERGGRSDDSWGYAECRFSDREIDLLIFPSPPQELKDKVNHYLRRIACTEATRELTPHDVEVLSRLATHNYYRNFVIILLQERLGRGTQPEQIYNINAIIRNVLESLRQYDIGFVYMALDLIEESGYFERARIGGGHLDEGLWTAFEELNNLKKKLDDIQSLMSRAIDQPQQDR